MCEFCGIDVQVSLPSGIGTKGYPGPVIFQALDPGVKK